MSSVDVIRQEKDLTEYTDRLINECINTLKDGKIEEAIQSLLIGEKHTRIGGDPKSTSRIGIKLVEVCKEYRRFDELNNILSVLLKKRSQLKQASAELVQAALQVCIEIAGIDVSYRGLGGFFPEIDVESVEPAWTCAKQNGFMRMDANPESIKLLTTLKKEAEGKVFVELEMVRVVRVLAETREKQGEYEEANKLIQQLKTETIGSLEIDELTELLLEQMRLSVAVGDYTQAELVSRKIDDRFIKKEETNVKETDKPEITELSNIRLCRRFHQISAAIAFHEENYSIASQHYEYLGSLDKKLNNESFKGYLMMAAIVILLAQNDSEQNTSINRLKNELQDAPGQHLFCQFVNEFLTRELINIPKFFEKYQIIFEKSSIFSGNKFSVLTKKSHLELFKQRIVENNFRIISKYYSRVLLSSLPSLTGLPNVAEVEKTITSLVHRGIIYVRINRPLGIVDFTKKKMSTDILTSWATEMDSLCSTLTKTNFLISRDEMVHKCGSSIPINKL